MIVKMNHLHPFEFSLGQLPTCYEETRVEIETNKCREEAGKLFGNCKETTKSKIIKIKNLVSAQKRSNHNYLKEESRQI